MRGGGPSREEDLCGCGNRIPERNLLFGTGRVGKVFVGGSGLASVKSSETAVEVEPRKGGALIGIHPLEGEDSGYDGLVRAFHEAEAHGVVLDGGLDPAELEEQVVTVCNGESGDSWCGVVEVRTAALREE
jgi:hypothetical protein